MHYTYYFQLVGVYIVLYCRCYIRLGALWAAALNITSFVL